jgi:hypothetical protein
VRCQKRVDLPFEQALLDGLEQLFGFGEGQAQMLDTLAVLLQGDHVRHGLFLAILGAHDKLNFDTHGGAPPVGVAYSCLE